MWYTNLDVSFWYFSSTSFDHNCVPSLLCVNRSAGKKEKGQFRHEEGNLNFHFPWEVEEGASIVMILLLSN